MPLISKKLSVCVLSSKILININIIIIVTLVTILRPQSRIKKRKHNFNKIRKLWYITSYICANSVSLW